MVIRAEPPAEYSPNAREATIAECLASAVDRLRESSDAPQLEAEVLLGHILGCNRAYLHTHPELTLNPDQWANTQALLKRRAFGEPLPYITGKIEFYGLEFVVDDRVLIPRPETETLVDTVIRLEGSPLSPGPMRRAKSGWVCQPTLVDVGTGSGCIAVALSVNVPDVRIYALDVSRDALAVARKNAERHGVVDKITFLESDLLENLPERVDLVVSNPPYIAAREWSSLPRGVREYEPQAALYGGQDGLDSIGRLLEQAPACLQPGGAVLVEIGAAQGRAAIDLAHKPFPGADITVLPDLAGYNRVLLVRTRPTPNRNAE
jgi:release factor glutamine methyltransferase